MMCSYSAMSGLDVRRKNATRESTSTLKAWLFQHIKNPYPTKGEKIMLAIVTHMTLTQVTLYCYNNNNNNNPICKAPECQKTSVALLLLLLFCLPSALRRTQNAFATSRRIKQKRYIKKRNTLSQRHLDLDVFSYPRLSYIFKVSSKSVQGFPNPMGSKFALSITLAIFLQQLV